MPCCCCLSFISSVPHSLYDPTTNPASEICLFTKDPPKPSDSDAAALSNSAAVPPNPIKEILAANPVSGVTKVLAISKLRKNYHQFQDKRRLLSSYSLFLADAAIIPLLPPLLGVKFYEKKKQPVPVNLRQNADGIRRELMRARDSIYMFLSSGPSTAIRVARSSMSRAEALSNIDATLKQLASHIPKGWKNVQSVHIKTDTSIALPVYNSAHSLEPLLPNPPEDEEEERSSRKGSKNGTSTSNKKSRAAVKRANRKRALSQTQQEREEEEEAERQAASTKKQSKKRKVEQATASSSVANGSTKKKAKSSVNGNDSAPSSSRPASVATPKRARSTEAAVTPAPSMKKAKKAATTPTPAPAPASAEVTTPKKTKKAEAKPIAKSAMKAPVTPASKKHSTKKAPATVASKKK